MIGWCPHCGAHVTKVTTTDGRGFCAQSCGLVWPVLRLFRKVA